MKRFFRATQNILFWFVINIITIFVSSDLYPQSTDSSKDIHAPANRLKFGNHLYKQKDYLRAIDEYNFYTGMNISEVEINAILDVREDGQGRYLYMEEDSISIRYNLP